MGNYIVQADLLKDITDAQLTQLTDDLNTGAIVTAIVDAMIADAEAEFDSYVAVKHTVPLAAPIPAEAVRLTKDLTIYHLWGRRHKVPEDVETRYDNAIAKLKDIAKGLATLGVDPPPAESSKASAGEVSGPERIFSRDKMGGF